MSETNHTRSHETIGVYPCDHEGVAMETRLSVVDDGSIHCSHCGAHWVQASKLDAAKTAWYDYQKSSRNGDGHSRIMAEANLNALLDVPGVGVLK